MTIVCHLLHLVHRLHIYQELAAWVGASENTAPFGSVQYENFFGQCVYGMVALHDVLQYCFRYTDVLSSGQMFEDFVC